MPGPPRSRRPRRGRRQPDDGPVHLPDAGLRVTLPRRARCQQAPRSLRPARMHPLPPPSAPGRHRAPAAGAAGPQGTFRDKPRGRRGAGARHGPPGRRVLRRRPIRPACALPGRHALAIHARIGAAIASKRDRRGPARTARHPTCASPTHLDTGRCRTATGHLGRGRQVMAAREQGSLRPPPRTTIEHATARDRETATRPRAAACLRCGVRGP